MSGAAGPIGRSECRERNAAAQHRRGPHHRVGRRAQPVRPRTDRRSPLVVQSSPRRCSPAGRSGRSAHRSWRGNDHRPVVGAGRPATHLLTAKSSTRSISCVAVAGRASCRPPAGVPVHPGANAHGRWSGSASSISAAVAQIRLTGVVAVGLPASVHELADDRPVGYQRSAGGSSRICLPTPARLRFLASAAFRPCWHPPGCGRRLERRANGCARRSGSAGTAATARRPT